MQARIPSGARTMDFHNERVATPSGTLSTTHTEFRYGELDQQYGGFNSRNAAVGALLIDGNEHSVQWFLT